MLYKSVRFCNVFLMQSSTRMLRDSITNLHCIKARNEFVCITSNFINLIDLSIHALCIFWVVELTKVVISRASSWWINLCCGNLDFSYLLNIFRISQIMGNSYSFYYYPFSWQWYTQLVHALLRCELSWLLNWTI